MVKIPLNVPQDFISKTAPVRLRAHLHRVQAIIKQRKLTFLTSPRPYLPNMLLALTFGVSGANAGTLPQKKAWAEQFPSYVTCCTFLQRSQCVDCRLTLT